MKKVLYSAALTLTLALGACNVTEDYSPQEILNQAMEETTEISSYYAEYKTTVDGEGSFTSKQWEKNGKIRIEAVEENGNETISVNDGKNVTTYNKAENSAFIFSLGEDMEGYVPPTLKEQALKTLEIMKDTHDITIGDSEKIAGRDTYHLIAKAKENDSLIGDIEIWVDKQTWMTLKTVSSSEDLKLTMEYTKYEPNAKIDDSLFTLDLPADVKIETFDDIMPKELTTAEAKEKLGDFLAFPASTGYELSKIEDMNVSETNEIALTYVKDDAAAFTLSILKPREGSELSTDDSFKVRGIPTEKIDENFFKMISWDENGLRYGIIFENPELTFDEVLTLTEQMEVIQ